MILQLSKSFFFIKNNLDDAFLPVFSLMIIRDYFSIEK